MKKIIFLLFFIALIQIQAAAKTAQEDKGLEEEKRESLSSTEAVLAPEEAAITTPKESPEYAFLSQLYAKKSASISDAVSVLTILYGAYKEKEDFSARLSFLKEKNAIPQDLARQLNPDMPLRKGLAAYMFCRALAIKGGLWLRIFGLSQRYALKELVYEEIIASGGVSELMGGKDLVDMFIRAADYSLRYPANLKGAGHQAEKIIRRLNSPNTFDRLSLDYGVWMNARYINYHDDDNDSTHPDSTDNMYWLDTRLWFRAVLHPPLEAVYKNKHSLYVRLKNLYSDTHPKYTGGGCDNDGPHIDYAYLNLDLRPLFLRLGRGYFTVGQGIAYSDVNDGLEATYFLSGAKARAFFARTQPHQDNIDTSVPGYTKSSDRTFSGLEYSYTAIPYQVFYAYTLIQRDYSNPQPEDPAHNYTYNSEYSGMGARGMIKSVFSYWWEIVAETGKSFIYETQEKKDIRAWAGVFALSYNPRIYTHPALYFKYAYGSGDKDRLSVTDTEFGNRAGRDRNFLYFGYIPTGYALNAQLSNLYFFKTGLSLKPLEKYALFKNCQLSVDHYLYYKDKASAGIYDLQATEDNHNVGSEVDFTLSWPIFSDLSFSLQYGHFMPGKAYPDSTRDSENYLSVSSSITF